MILDVIRQADCDVSGVPLDWEHCRACDGAGGAGQPFVYCTHCEGYGSLKAAALAGLEERLRRGWRSRLYEERGLRYDEAVRAALPSDQAAALDQIEAYAVASNALADEAEASFVIRCEDCWHPMNEGQWMDPAAMVPWVGFVETRRRGEAAVLAGKDISQRGDISTFYSPCDEGCRHSAPGRAYFDGWKEWMKGVPASLHEMRFEASWRQVDVRTLDWAHDLRPHKLAVLCLRCYAERKMK